MNVVEWTINNFSYWNIHVHEKQIECSSSFKTCTRILLYPRGLSGRKEHLVVHVYATPANKSSVLSGRLSCIDYRGSLIDTQEIGEKVRKGDYYELLPKLKFDDVAAKIRKNDIPNQDRFTLRCELKWTYDKLLRMYTTIDVFDSSVNIDLSSLNQIRVWNSAIQYHVDDSTKESLNVTKLYTAFSIQPIEFRKTVSVSTHLSILNFGSVIRTEEKEHVFQDNTAWTFLNLSEEKELLTKKGLTLLLRVKIIASNKYRHNGYFTSDQKFFDLLPTQTFTHSSGVPEQLSTKRLKASISAEPESSVTVLLNELMSLYQDHEFADFQLRCGEVSIPTHKNILSTRSPVFKAMLLNDTREAASGTLDIVDLDVHTLGRFLVFLYTGTVDDLEWEGALKLYYAAVKYQVPTLKRECFSVFLKNLSVSNVCDILSLADRHQDQELTKEAQDFILKYYNDVLRSEGWKTLMKNEPVFAVKTLTYFAEKNKFKVINRK